MEIVKYWIRKKEMTASVMCIGAERRGAPYADAQYWGRYGRCIVKGYPTVPAAPPIKYVDCALTCSQKHENIASCFIYTSNGVKPMIICRARVVRTAPVI